MRNATVPGPITMFGLPNFRVTAKEIIDHLVHTAMMVHSLLSYIYATYNTSDLKNI